MFPANEELDVIKPQDGPKKLNVLVHNSDGTAAERRGNGSDRTKGARTRTTKACSSLERLARQHLTNTTSAHRSTTTHSRQNTTHRLARLLDPRKWGLRILFVPSALNRNDMNRTRFGDRSFGHAPFVAISSRPWVLMIDCIGTRRTGIFRARCDSFAS